MMDENITDENLLRICNARGFKVIRGSEEQALEEEEPPPAKKPKSLDNMAPSKIAWDDLVKRNLVPGSTQFVYECDSVRKEFPEDLIDPTSLKIADDANAQLYNNCLRN